MMMFSHRNLFASRDQQQPTSSATLTADAAPVGNNNPPKSTTSTTTSSSLLEERLRSIGVCELHQNGESSHSIMSVRALYNYVVTKITEVCVVNDDNNNAKLLSLDDRSSNASSLRNNKRFNIPSPRKLARLQHDIGREQLGAYLQPRDMRHLVTPFFSSDEPTLLVRRHVVLMKFDPVRAVVLHDRVLLLNTKEIKDVGDYMLEALEKRLMDWRKDSMEDELFGASPSSAAAAAEGRRYESEHYYGPPIKTTGSRAPPKKAGSHMLDDIGSKMKEVMESTSRATIKESSGAELGGTKLLSKTTSKDYSEGRNTTTKKDQTQGADSETNEERQPSNHYFDEYGIAFELRIIDVVLQTVVAIMKKEAKFVHHRTTNIIDAFKRIDEFHSNNHSAQGGEYSQDILQLYRDEIDAMDSRVNNFIRALSKICDDEKQLALMNLSRLLTHPDRFVKPTNEILLEESDEPELIIEAYLTEGFKILNQLQLLHKQVSRTEKDLSMNLDAMRNRLLYINTMISVASLMFGMGAFIGGMFGVNVPFSLNSNPYAFRSIWIPTAFLMILFYFVLSRWLYLASTSNVSWSKIMLKGSLMKSRMR